MEQIDLTELLRPESAVERTIIADPLFVEGALQGKPRRGHPEGQIAYHIREVLDNVDKYSISPDRQNLRIIALIHDTFKHKVDGSLPKTGENHHAMIARRFAEKYVFHPVVLDIIELHDEAYNAWCKGSRDGQWDKAEARANRLLQRVSNLDLFTVFYRCDNETGDKDQSNYEWWLEFMKLNKLSNN